MSNAKYRDTYRKIKKVIESNISLLNTMIQRVTSFSGKMDKLMVNIGKISNELPTKKAKKKFFSKQDADDKIEVTDENFSVVFRKITEEFVSNPKGVHELNDLIRTYFVNGLKTVVDSYTEVTNQMDSSFQVELNKFEEAREKCNKAIQNYTSLVSKIEQLTEKLKPENTNGKSPDFVEKLNTQLSDAKSDLPMAETAARETTQEFDVVNIKFSIEAEKMLSTFESIDQKYEKDIRQVFCDFFKSYPSIVDINNASSEQIKQFSKHNNVSQIEHTPLINVRHDEFVAPSFQLPTFNIVDFIEPSQAFSSELSQKMATMVSDKYYEIPQGTIVTVISESGKEATIVDYVRMKSATVAKSDIQLQGLRRSIGQLKENIMISTPNSNFQWKAGEFLLITPHNNPDLPEKTEWCTDMFGRSGPVATDKLKQ